MKNENKSASIATDVVRVYAPLGGLNAMLIDGFVPDRAVAWAGLVPLAPHTIVYPTGLIIAADLDEEAIKAAISTRVIEGVDLQWVNNWIDREGIVRGYDPCESPGTDAPHSRAAAPLVAVPIRDCPLGAVVLIPLQEGTAEQGQRLTETYVVMGDRPAPKARPEFENIVERAQRKALGYS